MAKLALLIGVSEYESGLKPLPGSLKDIQAMQRVLQHPDMGGFEITILANPQRQQMEEAIEHLFSSRDSEDLVLLYFSGHGITDDRGRLYLTNRQTRKNDQKELVKTSAVAASLIHEVMGNSYSQRQVIILDCCFSGAFAEGMKAKDSGIVDIKNQLGGEGRVVLTSSTATQYSFAREGEELSVYTRYIVEGIETGAADTDNDGNISVDELHEFAKKKVREAAPAMKPEIYAVREGFKIYLAKAPVGNPKIEYRKEVEKCFCEGKLSPIGKRILKRRQGELKLSDEEVQKIENEVLEPYRKYQANLQEYEEALKEALEYEEILSEHTKEELKRFQQILQLRNEDIAPIEARFNLSSLPVEIVQQPPVISKQPKNVTQNEDDLSSEKGIDYTKLRDLLAAGNWKEADKETYLVMIQAVGKKDGNCFTENELLNFPCTDLRTIDRLWVKYSNGKFGLSVQKEIYLSVGGKPDGKYYQEAWEKYCEVVGWKVKGRYTEVIFNTSTLKGHLPFGCGVGFVWCVWGLFSRIETCKV